MILYFDGVAGKVVFNDRRPLPAKRLCFGAVPSTAPIAALPSTAPIAALPVAELDLDVNASPITNVDVELMVVSQMGGNRILRAVRMENASEAWLSESRHHSRRRRYNNEAARNSASKRCQRRDLRRNVFGA